MYHIIAFRVKWAWVTFESALSVSLAAIHALRFALDHIPKAQAVTLYQRFVTFEKQHGDRQGIEDVVVSKRRWVRPRQEQAAQRAEACAGAGHGGVGAGAHLGVGRRSRSGWELIVGTV